MAATGVSEEFLPAVVPILVYWVGAAVYHLTLCRAERNRLFTEEEEETQNLATRRQVLVGVLVNQAVQMALVALSFMMRNDDLAPAKVIGAARSSSMLQIVGQMAVGMLFIDFWVYFIHRLTHENKFLYKHVHAMHHELIVPYAYGAQYVHPIEAILGDILGGMLSAMLSGMSPWTATVFFSLLSLKALDDHCGMWFPNHPIHRWMTNNSAFHAIHHQHVGVKNNYSTNFLATWDVLLGTKLSFSVEPRKEGGYQLQIAKEIKRE